MQGTYLIQSRLPTTNIALMLSLVLLAHSQNAIFGRLEELQLQECGGTDDFLPIFIHVSKVPTESRSTTRPYSPIFCLLAMCRCSCTLACRRL